MGHWSKAKTKLDAVSTLRGGVQKEDPQYKTPNKVPQPTDSPPQYAQQHASFQQGENSSYYQDQPYDSFSVPQTHYPSQSFPPQTSLPQPQGSYSSMQYSPPQGFQPPMQYFPSESSPPPMQYSPPQSSPPHMQYVQPYSSPPQTQYSPPQTGHEWNQYQTPQAAQQYSSHTTASGTDYGGQNEQYVNDSSRPWSDQGSSYYNEPSSNTPSTLQRSLTTQAGPYNDPYDETYSLGQRSYTMPVQAALHECSQHWDMVLDRCLFCQPLR